MRLTEIRHVLSGTHHIAYGTEGNGEVDLVYVGTGFVPFTMYRDYPPFAAMLDRLGSFSRLILTDRRGVGSSDPITAAEPGRPEEIAGDLAAILVALGSPGAAVMAEGLAVPAAVELAARHPKLVTHLVLFNGFARALRADDYPFGFTRQQGEAVIQDILDGSQETGFTAMMNPELPDDDPFHRFASRGGQIGASRGSAEAIYGSLVEVDVRHQLPRIQAPTLVMHRVDSKLYEIGQGRYLADHIPGARLVELAGSNQTAYLGETSGWLSEVEQFVVGHTTAAESTRTMATMLFTDIVGSTEIAADVGDRRWRELLDQHDAVTAAELAAHGGRRISATGDGALMTLPTPTAAVGAASGIMQALSSLGLQLRAAIHTGEVETRGDDIGGLAVNLAARILDLAEPGQILVSGAVPAITIGSAIEYTANGVHELRGVPGRWPVLEARRTAR